MKAESHLPVVPKSSTPTRQQIQEARRAGLTAEAQAMLDERRAVNTVTQELANLSWGKNLPDSARRALAEYCRRYRLDPAGDIEILGGKLYRTAAYFIRRGAELRRRGLIREVGVSHIQVDARLDELAKGDDNVAQLAREDIRNRAWLRVQHNIPDGAKGAVVVVIQPKHGAAVVGVNYAGSVGNKKDPIGDAEPGKTAETRAYRRAWRHLIDTMPDLKSEEGEIDESGADVMDVVMTVAQDEAERNARIPHAPQKQLTEAVEVTVPANGKSTVQIDDHYPSDDELLAQDRETAAADGELPLADTRRTQDAVRSGR